MAHAPKPYFVFRRNGRVHLNRQGRQFSRLLAAELCASAVVLLDTSSSEVVKGIGYPLHSPVSPSLPLPCVTVCQHVSTGLYHMQFKCPLVVWSGLDSPLVTVGTQFSESVFFQICTPRLSKIQGIFD